MVVEAWGPLGQGAVLEDVVLTEIGRQVGRTASQVTLRWHVQRGRHHLPKSMRRERMEQNLAIFDFELTDAQMSSIDGLDRGRTAAGDPTPRPSTWSESQVSRASAWLRRIRSCRGVELAPQVPP
jgi:2,5-diketo-D-gluconate reductase A